MSQSKSKAAPAASTVHRAKTPAVPKTTTRLRTPSITTPLLAATVTDHPPVVQIPASTAAPLTGAASVTASIPSTPSIQPASGTTPLATPPATSYGVPAPPDVVIPSPAPGFFPEPLRRLSGSSPTKTQLAAMTSAIQDLGSFGDSADVLGPLAPAAAAVAGALTLGLQWRALRAPTTTWDTYVRTQDARAWNAAMTLVDELKPLFQLAVTKNASLASKYPGLAKLLGARDAIAEQGLATKKRNAKAGATKALSTAEAAASPSAAPAVATASPRTVTVTG